MRKTSLRSGGVKDEERDGASAATRTLDLLGTIARSGRALTVPELCGILDLPKPTAHRLCQKLEGEGYLAREPGGRRYAVGPRLLRLGLDAVRWGASAERRAILQKIVRQMGETCNFTALAGDEVIYLDRVEQGWPLRLHLEPGSRVPLHCTASGKLFLAMMTQKRRERAIAALELTPFTVHTITDPARLAEELAEIAAQGFSFDREEFLLGLGAIAVPVRDANGATVAALACHAPSARLDLDHAVERLPLLQAAADELAGTIET